MISDANIAAAVAQVLRWKIASDEVQATVQNGWVTLTGNVKDQAQKTAAERAALYVYGVRGIRNYIAVMATHKPVEPVRIIEAVSMAAN